MRAENLPTAGPDQLLVAGRFAADEWQDHGVEVALLNSIHRGRSYAIFQVSFTDGGVAHFLVSPHGECEHIAEDEDTVEPARDRIEARRAEAMAKIDRELAEPAAPVGS